MLLSFSPASADDAWPSDPVRARAALDAQWELISHPTDTVGIRGVFRYAVETAAQNWHVERIETALALARSMQDLDPASKTFGNFRWRHDQAGVFDQNAVEFCLLQAGLLRLRYHERLNPAAARQLDELMVDGIAGMRRHRVPIDYTNIFLTKTWNLIVCGETLGREDVTNEGYRQLDDWMHFTAQNGITEYGAVVYYGVDMEALALLAKYAGRPAGRAQAEAALRYFWADIAANWWAPGDRLGGANSRTYDYLYGRGYLESQTWAAGWLRTRPNLESAGWLSEANRDSLNAIYTAGEWAPPAEPTTWIRHQLPRMVTQRWGSIPERHAWHYIGKSFSLASSGSSRSKDERTLVANLGDTPQVPQLTFFMDGRGDAYGTKKSPEKQGAMKALHLTPFVATVQRGAEILQVLSDEPLLPKYKRQPGELACFYSQFTLPAAAEVWFGDQRAQPGTPEQPVVVPAGVPVFVRLGDAVIAVRFLLTITTDGKPAPVHFIADHPGDPARRLTIIHSSEEPRSGRGTAAVWVRGAEGLDNAGFAAFRQAFTDGKATASLAGNILTLEVDGNRGPLRIEADLANGERRVLAGGEPDALLSVNGRDVGRELLGGFLPN